MRPTGPDRDPGSTPAVRPARPELENPPSGPIGGDAAATERTDLSVPRIIRLQAAVAAR